MTHSIGRSYRRSATDAVEAGLFPYDESGDSLDSNPSIPSSIIHILIGVFGGHIPPNILDEDLSQSPFTDPAEQYRNGKGDNKVNSL